MVQPNVTLFTFWEVAGGRLSFGRCGVGIVGGWGGEGVLTSWNWYRRYAIGLNGRSGVFRSTE